MGRVFTVLALVAAVVGFGCAQPRHADASGTDSARPMAKAGDQKVAPGEVPAAVMAAAQAAVPGFTAKSAEKETEHGKTVYSIEGTADGKPCEIEVTADGKVTEIDREDDAEDDEDDGEDDDEDEDGDDGEDDEDDDDEDDDD